MTQHPITPPSPELAAQWVHEIYGNSVVIPLREPTLQVIERAVQWGADQELEACCALVRDNDGYDAALALRADRRPKPPLKEQALVALSRIENTENRKDWGINATIIRLALEQLDD